MDDTQKGWISTLVNVFQTAVTKFLGWIDALMSGKANVKWLWVIVGALIAWRVLPGVLGKRGRR